MNVKCKTHTIKNHNLPAFITNLKEDKKQKQAVRNKGMTDVKNIIITINNCTGEIGISSPISPCYYLCNSSSAFLLKSLKYARVGLPVCMYLCSNGRSAHSQQQEHHHFTTLHKKNNNRIKLTIQRNLLQKQKINFTMSPWAAGVGWTVPSASTPVT